MKEVSPVLLNAVQSLLPYCEIMLLFLYFCIVLHILSRHS